MTISNDELYLLVLDAVANDYEPFDMIVRDISRWTIRLKDPPDVRQIEQALMKAIADKNVIVYEPSDELRRFVAVKADPSKIALHWFYLTEQGKELIRRTEEEETKAGTYMAGWEPDPNGGWRISGE